MTASSLVAAAEPLAATEERQPLGRRLLVRRALVLGDVIGLSLAFVLSVLVFGLSAEGDHARPTYELLVFFVSLPAWTLLASLFGLYRHDEGRMGHSTVDDLFGVVQLVTLGAWTFFIGCW